MKKFIALITAMLLIGSLAIPAYASENDFVPSITYKAEPEIVPVIDENGKEALGTILDAEGEVIDYVELDCLEVTPIAYVWDEEKGVPADVEELLLFVYDGLYEGSMEIPYEKFASNLNSEDMVIRDLFDARWRCGEHPAMVAPEGVVVELTFDLGVDADAELYVMTYDEETGEWEPIVSTVNNGDGTVTCTFEHLCAISFSMPLVGTVESTAAANASNATMWVIVLILAAVAVVGMLIAKNKKKVTTAN